MKALITQSNYIPWKGYFDAIQMADVVVLYDEMQYTKRDWRNRNKIKTQNGLQWLSIPVQVKGKFHQKINETEVSGKDWRIKHWNTLSHQYKKAPFFANYKAELKEQYLNSNEKNLSEINRAFIELINSWLGINTPIRWSREFDLTGEKTEKLVHVCEQLGATEYLAGPRSRNYLNEQLFTEKGISVHWIDYSNYPEYPQLYGAFDHGVTVLDLLFNTGDNSFKYMKNF